MAKISSYPHTVPTTGDSIVISKSSNKTTRSTTVGDIINLINTGLLPGVGTVTSIGITAPSAFTVANSPITDAGTITITGAGTASQYIDGTGSLQDSANQALDTTSNVTFSTITGDGAAITNIDKYTTSYIDSNIYTKTEADSLFTSGFVGAITPTSTAPTQDGLYSCSTSGTYTNFGGEVVSLNSQVVSIAVENNQTTFTQLITPTGITFDSVPTSGSTNAVESGGVVSYIEDDLKLTRNKRGSIIKFSGNLIITTTGTPKVEVTGNNYIGYNGGTYLLGSSASKDWDNYNSVYRVNLIYFNVITLQIHIVDFSNQGDYLPKDHLYIGHIRVSGELIETSISGDCVIDGVNYKNGINVDEIDASIIETSNNSNTISEIQTATVNAFNGYVVIDSVNKTIKTSERLFVSTNLTYYDVTSFQAVTNWDSTSLVGLHHIIFEKSTKLFKVVRYDVLGSYNKVDYLLIGTILGNNETLPHPTNLSYSINGDGVIIDGNIVNKKVDNELSRILNTKNTDYLGALDFQGFDTDYSNFIIDGQSLSMGWEAGIAITTTPTTNCFMMGSSVDAVKYNDGSNVFNPLKATVEGGGVLGENAIVSATNVFKKLLDRQYLGNDKRLLSFGTGEGGKSIEQLSKNCTNTTSGTTVDNLYNTYFKASLTRAKAIADGESKTISCPAIIWMQGEHNYTGTGGGLTTGTNQTRDKDTYKSLLLQLKNDKQTEIMSIYGQTKKPLFFIYVTSGTYISNKEMSINMAQLEFSQENDDVILINPTYQTPDYSEGHLTANGYRWYGELIAKSLFKTLIKQEYSNPVYPLGMHIDGNRIVIPLNVPSYPLKFDTFTVESEANYGIKVWRDNVDVTILKVETLGNNLIILTDTFLKGVVEVSYAGQDFNGSGNLRDSDGWKSLYNYYDDSGLIKQPSYNPKTEDGSDLYGLSYPLQNYCVNFYLTNN